MKCPCKLPLVLLVLEIVSVCRGVDKTLEAGASGCEVAKAAIDKVVASNIFKKTENFVLVRLALVSAFGTSASFIPGGTGIWQLTEQNLNDSQAILNHLNLAKSIEEILCINFTTAEKEDLKIPLYSAVCAMLLIQGQQKDVPNRADANQQAQYWIDAAKIVSTEVVDHFKEEFAESVAILDQNKGHNDTMCFLCRQSPSDVIFLMDESTSMDGWSQYETAFVVSVLDQFKATMDQNTSRLAFITFSGNPNTIFPFTSIYSLFKSAVQSHKYEGGSTALYRALNAASDLMKDDSLSRLEDESVRKLVFMLTDGKQYCSGCSEINLEQSSKGLKSLGATVYSIGFTSETDQTELETMASKPEYVKIYQTPKDCSDDVLSFLYDTCKISISFTGSTVADYNSSFDTKEVNNITLKALTVGEIRYFTVKVSEGKVTILDFKLELLEVVIYASFRQPYPSSADYDFMTRCSSGKECKLEIKDAEDFANEVCQTGDYGKVVNVAVDVVGPNDSENNAVDEDVEVVITVAPNDESATSSSKNSTDYEDENSNSQLEKQSKSKHSNSQINSELTLDPSYSVHLLLLLMKLFVSNTK